MATKPASMRLMNVLNSSIVKKQFMAATGLLLCGFLISHLIGNYLILVGPEAFNTYAYKLTSTPLIYVAELILGTIFLVHLGLAFKLTIENNTARGQRYVMKKKTGRGASFASSTMPYTGTIILIFLVLHILNLKFGTYYETEHSGVQMRDLYRLVMEYFSDIKHVIGYIVAMFALAIHLTHGFWSAFQSLGFNHPRYNCCVKKKAWAFAILVGVGFSILPIYCFLQGGK